MNALAIQSETILRLTRTLRRIVAILLFLPLLSTSTNAEPLTAMTTRETPYYVTAEEETPLGTLPPYVTLSILELRESSSRMTITFEAASGSWITAFVDKELIDASFYATPEPYYPTLVEPTPESTSTPVPTPTPLPPDAQRITLTRRTPAYDPANAFRVIGYFPQGVEILVLSNADAQAFSHVLYVTGDGREIRAICRQADILPPALLQASAPTSPGRGGEVDPLKWFENQEGYKEALSLQRSTKRKILLYFHTSWNNDCKTLSDELLMTSDFLQATKEIIKVSINPEEGKKDAALAAKYDVSILPTTLVLDAPGSEPRKIKLLKKMYGKARVVDVPKAVAIIETTQ